MNTERMDRAISAVENFPYTKIGKFMCMLGSPIAGYSVANAVQEHTGDLESSTTINLGAACGLTALNYYNLRQGPPSIHEE